MHQNHLTGSTTAARHSRDDSLVEASRHSGLSRVQFLLFLAFFLFPVLVTAASLSVQYEALLERAPTTRWCQRLQEVYDGAFTQKPAKKMAKTLSAFSKEIAGADDLSLAFKKELKQFHDCVQRTLSSGRWSWRKRLGVSAAVLGCGAALAWWLRQRRVAVDAARHAERETHLTRERQARQREVLQHSLQSWREATTQRQQARARLQDFARSVLSKRQEKMQRESMLRGLRRWRNWLVQRKDLRGRIDTGWYAPRLQRLEAATRQAKDNSSDVLTSLRDQKKRFKALQERVEKVSGGYARAVKYRPLRGEEQSAYKTLGASIHEARRRLWHNMAVRLASGQKHRELRKHAERMYR